MLYPSNVVYPGEDIYPLRADPVVVDWDHNKDKLYHTGISKGVLYLGDVVVPWNGITGMDESGQGAGTVLYRDGIIYYADVEPGDYTGSLKAYFWPDEFSEALGMPEIAPGFNIDHQRPKQFGFTYRTLVGSGMTGDKFGYQIHLVYNAVASIGGRSRKTRTNIPEMVEFSFDIVATPVTVKGYRPSAHFIIDTRNLAPGMLEVLEEMLYGGQAYDAHLPHPEVIYDMLKFGSAITFVDHGDGTWTASGSSLNLIDNGDGTWQILNVDGEIQDFGMPTEHYLLHDTP